MRPSFKGNEVQPTSGRRPHSASLLPLLLAIALAGCTTPGRLGRFLAAVPNEAHLEQAVHARTFLYIPTAPQELLWH